VSGVGGPLPVGNSDLLTVGEALECFGGVVVDGIGDDALPDEGTLAAEAERAAIARRIGNIVAACQREAVEGVIPISVVEMRLVALSDDVRAGIHGGSR